MKTKKVNKSDYYIDQMIGGQYRITNGTIDVWGGDSACEDHYNEELVNDIYNRWDGELICDSSDCDDDDWYICTGNMKI